MEYTRFQKFGLVALRFGIGWHFLYEGLVKVTNPNWSSVGYLLDSGGFLKGFFIHLANNPDVLKVIDLVNMWGLVVIGLALILGLFSRPAILAGIVLLALYYFSHPPFIGIKYALPTEGSYLVVSKTLLELIALVVLLAFPTSREFGLDRFIFKKRQNNNQEN